MSPQPFCTMSPTTLSTALAFASALPLSLPTSALVSPSLGPSFAPSRPSRSHPRANPRSFPPRACTTPQTPMPQLYSAWFPPSNELACQMRDSVTAALSASIYQMEIKWPCVPNLEEKDFGTKNNFEFGKHVAATLGMSAPEAYPLIKRYLGQFSDLYWVTQLAPLFPDVTVWAVFTDGITKDIAVVPDNVRLTSLKAGALKTEEGDVVVIVDPRPTDVWKRGAKLQASSTSPLIFLNSQVIFLWMWSQAFLLSAFSGF